MSHQSGKTTVKVQLNGRLQNPNGEQPNSRPQQIIKDRWLEAFGFTIGQTIIIDAQQGLLIIRIEEPF